MDSETQAQMYSQIGEPPKTFHFPPQWFTWQANETFQDLKDGGNSRGYREWMDDVGLDTNAVQWLEAQAAAIPDAEGSGFARVEFLAKRNQQYGQKKDGWIRQQYRQGATAKDLGIKNVKEQGQADISAHKLWDEHGQFLNLQYDYNFGNGTMVYKNDRDAEGNLIPGSTQRIPGYMMDRYREHQEWKKSAIGKAMKASAGSFYVAWERYGFLMQNVKAGHITQMADGSWTDGHGSSWDKNFKPLSGGGKWWAAGNEDRTSTPIDQWGSDDGDDDEGQDDPARHRPERRETPERFGLGSQAWSSVQGGVWGGGGGGGGLKSPVKPTPQGFGGGVTGGQGITQSQPPSSRLASTPTPLPALKKKPDWDWQRQTAAPMRLRY